MGKIYQDVIFSIFPSIPLENGYPSNSFFARFANGFNNFTQILPLLSPSMCQIMTSSYFNAPKFLKKVISVCHLRVLMNKMMLNFISMNCRIDRLSLALKTQNHFALYQDSVRTNTMSQDTSESSSAVERE